MTLKKIVLFCFLVVSQLVLAQNNPAIHLKEVVVSDSQLKNNSNTQSVLKLNDSILRKNQSSLTSLLNYNTVIYFKENGLGMVSSPSFRGTTAQQTAVIWNGININSQLLGQTDFNVINTYDFNNITVRAGGGSSIYGSSAIGGSIHLNNDLVFGNFFNNDVSIKYGSFNTYGGHYRMQASNEKFSAQVSITHNSSDNDYDYIGTDRKNLNGAFYNTSISANFGYKINDSNFLKFYSQLFDGERHFSLITPNEPKTKYQDVNSRNMLEWVSFQNQFTSKLKVAFISESYKYFDNIEQEDIYSKGKAESLIAKYDLAYQLGENIRLNAILDYTRTKGFGSNVPENTRNIGSVTVLMKHQVTDKFDYELSARKELTDNYKSPYLFSAGAEYGFTKFYKLKINASKNFRIPTFNDLYWQGAGNPDLKPESSYQGEIENEFRYKEFKLTVTGYYTKVKDMLRWLPTGTVWKPMNTDKVKIYGLEALLNWQKKYGNHYIDISGTYAYTVSKDERLDKQLTYVPYHKATAAVSYGYQRWSAYYQFLYNGEVFTRTDNNSRYNIKSYQVANVGLDYNFGKTNSYKIGAQVLNLWNEKYQSVENRPLPGRNFNMYLTFNF
ncbi:TonB-dependent receptor plug domain-containing protein [Flavobacterium sp. '19STA2R22 D10 B1']|uniref:TonB-dependent receptor plug domain-containing protein n=1 Tax=Flavobacterium aerium TaxID=3037261 RepID=UPI00278BBA2A|nr:TonB-dependent receptor [Flavobacterium sp. '19STA2R22 D10 B1']